jgi:O-antigen/teichoic acid export membrane protein
MTLAQFSRSAVGTAIGQGLSLLGVVASARLLGDAAFAELGFALVTSVMAAGVAAYGPALRAARAVAAGVTSGWRSETLGIVLVALLLGVVASVAGRFGWLPFFAAPSHGAAFTVLIAGTALQLLASHLLLGAEAFRGLTNIRMIGGIAAACGLVGGSVLDGARGAMLGAAAGQYLTAVLMVRLSSRHVGRAEPASDTDPATIIGSWAFAAALLAAPALWIPQLLLASGPDGAAQSARVTVLAPLLQGVLFLPGQLGQMLLAPMARSSDDAAIVRSATRAAALAAAGPSLLLAITAPWWGAILGPAYVGIDAVAVPLLLAAGTQGASVAVVRSLEMRGETRSLVVLNGLAAAIAIVGTVWFAEFGARGYAWSLCAAFAVHACGLAVARHRIRARALA